jgi:exonuclease SbcD
VRPDDGGVVTVTSRDGAETALVACLPFLSQRHVVRASDLMGQDADQSTQQYAERVRRLLVDLCASFRGDTINVIAAHCMVAGATVAGSERLAHTMFEYAITSAAFPAAAHYVALGHLHQAQSIAGPCPIHYSGSPLQLDFGEAGQDKFALLVDASVGAPAKVTPVRLTSGRKLRTVEGTLEQLRVVAAGIDDDYVRVTITEPVRAGLADDIRELIPNAVDITVDRPVTDRERRDLTRSGRSPHDLFAVYMTDAGIDDDRVLALFDDLLEEVGAT